MAHMGMGHEQNGSGESYMNGPGDNWVGIAPQYSSHQPSPVHEYPSYSFIQPAPPAMPHAQPFTRMAPSTHCGPQQQLLPLIMPSHPTWPSMLTNPVGGYLQPVPIPPPTMPLKSKLPSIHSTPTPRKTLSDADRRRMCQYHEDNPQTKQTEIGAMFGVERSTVSKVLRNKEKYLFPEDRSSSPVKRVKGKYPDIERALSSWVQKSQSKGIPMTDAIIKEKAQFFASAVGSSESHQKANSSSWLEKFKQKNGLGAGKITRRASETSLPDNTGNFLRPDSAISSAADSPTGISPTSPGALSPSPLSASKSAEDIRATSESMDSFIDFNDVDYKQPSSTSVTSLSSAAFTSDSGTSSFSAGPTSPTTPFTFSPDAANQLFSHHQQGIPPSQFQRPRSQTFPNLGIDGSFLSQVEDTHHDPLNNINTTPKYLDHNLSNTNGNPQNGIENSQQVSTPIHELNASFGLDSTISSPILHHSSSNGSMAPPYSTPLTTASSSITSQSAPGSPTREDARRALDTLLNFFNHAQPGLVNNMEYMTMVKLTEKLRLGEQAAAQGVGQGVMGNGGRLSVSDQGMGPGGLQRIVEADGEMVLKVEDANHQVS